MTRIRLEVAAAAALLCAGLLSAPASARGRGEPVNGRWLGVVPCVPTAVDPTSNHTTCTGASTWSGTWTGVTHYVFDGTVDLVSGTGRGRIDETFTGDSEGRIGTMRFAETVVLTPTGVPDTASVRIDASIVEGTGALGGVHGRVVFTGLVNLVGAVGTFSGYWAPPAR